MYLYELRDRLDTALKQYVPSLSLTDMTVAQMIFDAENGLQEETDYLTYEDTVTVPAMTTLTPVATSFRWRHIYSCWDMVNGLQYERRDYDQFVYAMNHWQGVNNNNQPWRQLPPQNTPNEYPQGDPASYIFTIENHNLYVFPFPSVDTVLTFRYDPMIPILSAADPYFADWLDTDAHFVTKFQTTAIYREFIPYWEAILEWMILHYLEGFLDSVGCQKRAALAQARLYGDGSGRQGREGYIKRMLKNKQVMSRMVQVPYNNMG